MSKRWLIATITALGLIVAACGGGGATTTTGATGADTTGASAEPTGYEHLDQALAGEFDGTTVEVWAQWLPDSSEASNFTYTLEPFQEATGITVNFQPTPDYETALQVAVDGGNAPDLAQIAQPGKMHQYADAGSLVGLSDWLNTDKLSSDMVPAFYELGTHNDTLYGVYYKADVKSIVWYPVQGFADAGYEVPTTWDELIALSDQIIADGNGNPWCISIESQEADGWVATDWVEDILLRTAPPETYDQWITHEIPFNDPEVLEAAEYMSQIWFTPDYAMAATRTSTPHGSVRPRIRCSPKEAPSAGCRSRQPGSVVSGEPTATPWRMIRISRRASGRSSPRPTSTSSTFHRSKRNSEPRSLVRPTCS